MDEPRGGPHPAADPEAEARAALDRSDRGAALGVLMRAYGTAVHRFCRQVLADEDLADDVHQTTFVQAYEALDRFGGRSTFRTWLFSIARHRCLDAAKSRRRRRARFEPLAETPAERPAAVADGPDAEARLGARDLARALSRCLAELTAEVRAALMLRYQQGMSYPEMAEVCGERPATLQARVSRALPLLRRCLERLEETT